MKSFSFIYIFIIALFGACKSDSKVRIYLIPDRYEGPLILVEDEGASDRLHVNGDTTIFDFRKSFIIRIKGKFIEGSYSLERTKYYYIDSLGNRKAIPFALGHRTKVDSSKAYIYLKHSQIRENSECDLISTPRNFVRNIYRQQYFCDSLFSIRPS
jgi:hypothetical protein